MVKYQTVTDEIKTVTKSWKCLKTLKKINIKKFKKVLTKLIQRDKISLLSTKRESLKKNIEK